MKIEDLKKLKIAYVHDWLTGMRGGENVLEQMIKVLGPADLYTLVSKPENLSETILECDIKTSFIQDLPFSGKNHQYYLPLFPMAAESFDLMDYDLVVSTSHCVARGVVTKPATFHWCYFHTPVRYAWDFSEIYRLSMKPQILMKYAWPIMMHYLRMWDVACVQRVDHYTCNSNYVGKRIQKYYGKSSETIYPPADTSLFQLCEDHGEYYFTLAALVPYKRVDLAVKACLELDRPLKVAGAGPMMDELWELTRGSKVELLGRVEHDQAAGLYQGAKAFLFPGEEDFGITPLEAQCGTPVIAYGKGGALETVVEGKTGVFAREQTIESFKEAILNFEGQSFKSEDCRAQAERFSNEVFRKNFEASLLNSYAAFLDS